MAAYDSFGSQLLYSAHPFEILTAQIGEEGETILMSGHLNIDSTLKDLSFEIL